MVSEIFSTCENTLSPVWAVMGMGVIGSLIAIGIMIALIVFVGLYIYHSLAWVRIARKMKYKRAWLSWIPIANIAMILQLGGFHWAFIFLILIPILGWLALAVLGIISLWRIFEKRKYPGWFSLGIIITQVGWILYLIAIGLAAWSDRK